jgi:hypothetical protein
MLLDYIRDHMTVFFIKYGRGEIIDVEYSGCLTWYNKADKKIMTWRINSADY